MAIVCHETKQKEEAFLFFEKAKNLFNNLKTQECSLLEINGYCKLDMGIHFFKKKQADRASALFLDAIRVDGNFNLLKQNLMQLGIWFIQNGERSKALKIFISIQTLHPGFEKVEECLNSLTLTNEIKFRKKFDTPFEENQLLNLLLNVTSYLSQIHQTRHINITPDNIFILEDDKIEIIAQPGDRGENLAPETTLTRITTSESDIYSLGIILMKMWMLD